MAPRLLELSEMNDHSTFTLFVEPQSGSLDTFLEHGVAPFLTAAIINPFGPTLTIVGGQGRFQEGECLKIVYLMLNPFKQDCRIVGQAQLNSKWNPARDLSPFFELPFGSCPSLLFPSVYYNDEQSVVLHAAFLRRFQDARSVLGKIREYPGDPWNRVKQDVPSSRNALGWRKKDSQ